MSTDSALAEAVAALQSMDHQSLATRWAATFGHPAPHRIKVNFLRASLAWRLQLDAQAARQGTSVDRLLRGVRRLQRDPQGGQPTAGTRLVREWQGRTHHVQVLAKGFEYHGQSYRSLTAIARQITGTPWSGPRFFGLKA